MCAYIFFPPHFYLSIEQISSSFKGPLKTKLEDVYIWKYLWSINFTNIIYMCDICMVVFFITSTEWAENVFIQLYQRILDFVDSLFIITELQTSIGVELDVVTDSLPLEINTIDKLTSLVSAPCRKKNQFILAIGMEQSSHKISIIILSVLYILPKE